MSSCTTARARVHVFRALRLGHEVQDCGSRTKTSGQRDGLISTSQFVDRAQGEDVRSRQPNTKSAEQGTPSSQNTELNRKRLGMQHLRIEVGVDLS